MLFRQRWRGAVSFVGLGIKETARQSDISTPQMLSGAGAPSAVVADGSIYLRNNGTTAADSFYMRIAGAWVAFDAT
jgi:hypothetical protein